MNARFITAAIICLVSTISLQQGVNAQLERVGEPQPRSFTQTIVQPLTQKNVRGTDSLQEEVLMQINTGLVDGWLSIVDSTVYKNEINKISEEETWYKSLNSSIPDDLIAKDSSALNAMSQKLQARPSVQTPASGAMHADIDGLVGKALAKNRISSAEAERYYLRLAQIESSDESNSRKNGDKNVESLAINSSLNQLRTDIQKRLTK